MTSPERDDAAVSGRSIDEPFPLDEPFPFQKQLFIVLMLLAVALRLGLLIVSRHYLRSDEAVTAMEALDIMAGDPIPLFHYGQAYGGGHTLEALMAIPWFAAFGASDYLFKLGPALLSAIYIGLVYLTLYRFFDKRVALIAAALFAFFAPFVAFNFYNNGGSVTTLFGWLGLYLFFHSYFAERERPWPLLGSGAALGFAYYCFDYALFYFAAAIALWLFKYKIELWKQWRSVLLLSAGFLIGASPLIYFNLTHEFANFKHVLLAAVRPDSGGVASLPTRSARLLYHDLPAFFSLDVEDFPARISPLSYFSYGLFLISVAYVGLRLAPRAASAMRSPGALLGEQRMLYLFALMIFYLAIYSVSNAAGGAPRYLIVLCPFIPIVLAWTAHDLGKRHFVPAALFIAAFAGLQVPFLVTFAGDDTVMEWDVRTHGEDMRKLAEFLLANDLTTVVTPYEIKWKLMFESRGKIVCAAYLFGFDRDPKYNAEVVDRVNREKMPVAFVFDKEFKLPKVALKINPEGAFDLDAFHAFLKRSRITYRVTPVGQDYVVYHGFSKPFRLIAR